MAKTDKPAIDIGREYLNNLYTKTNIETKEAQPIYILHRDTIKSFVHEKLHLFGIEGKLFGLIGVEVTIITSLLTATFNDWNGIKGNLIQGTFVAFAIIFAVWTLKVFFVWFAQHKNCTVDALIEELGGRGSVIKSNPEKTREVDG
jgi:hypothetical protein